MCELVRSVVLSPVTGCVNGVKEAGAGRWPSWSAPAAPGIITSSWSVNETEVLTGAIALSKDGDDVPSRIRFGPRGGA